MKILYTKNFLKDLSKIPGLDRKKIEEFSFIEILKHSSFHSIKGFEKLQATKIITKSDSEISESEFSLRTIH